MTPDTLFVLRSIDASLAVLAVAAFVLTLLAMIAGLIWLVKDC